ncbi:XdhC family protein [Rhizobium sp. L1K21]|uniref:XdhC family protein n=1 Tax=Rhizobium sp. L1K21 TaxID=2954933 RepID=UPI0020933A56|nr:XdhC family protein [Rhizobium sp. L1K21]MCO6185753.1 XdhC family protein [Rhizobium sp. L1K21]
MDLGLLKELNTLRAARKAAILVSNLSGGPDQLVREGQSAEGVPQDVINKAFLSGKSGIVEGEGSSYFLNVQVPPARIVVIGAVHISQALAAMAGIAGFDIEIIDPRTAFATPERFAGIKLTANWPEDVLKERPLDTFTALVAVTHDPKIDDYPLISALKTGCFYVGALGSRKTHGKRVERLQAAGLSGEQIGRISAPIGLDIGASSPGEIAVAILGDIIQALRRRGLSA